MASEERLRELEEKYEGYTVYDNRGSKIGKVDDLFVDEKDNEEYIGVKMGFLGRKSTLIPTEIVRVNEGDRAIEVSESKDHVEGAPSFGDDEEVTAEYEDRIRQHFGLESLGSSGRGSYGASGGAAAGSTADSTTDTETSDDADREGSSSGYTTGEDRQGAGVETHDVDRGEETAGAGTSSGERSGSDVSETAGTASGSRPTVTKQTEETETFQEDGRTKIRRRIIREEVVDADEQG